MVCSFPRPGVWKNKRPWRANQRNGQGRVSPWAPPVRICKDLKKRSFEHLPDGLKWYRLDGAPMTGHGSGFEEGIVYGLFSGLHGGLEERRHLIVRQNGDGRCAGSPIGPAAHFLGGRKGDRVVSGAVRHGRSRTRDAEEGTIRQPFQVAVG